MTRTFILAGIILTMLCHSASAQTSQTRTTAGMVANQCKQVNSGNLTTSVIAAGLCTFLIRGFVDGFQSGANRGMNTAFIDDQKNRATTQGIADVQLRLSIIRPKAECLPPQATIKQVNEVFVQYMESHPERREEPYREPLTDAIESYFCPR